MTGAIVLVVTVVLATAAGLTMRARNGRLRPARQQAPDATTGLVGAETAPAGIDLAAVGAEVGAQATLLQFSSTFCAPCRATHRMLASVAEAVPGVRHVEVDVADSDAALELVRRLDIRRTPTTLVLDADAREVRRASGVPRREQVLAALAEAVGTGTGSGTTAEQQTPTGRAGHVR